MPATVRQKLAGFTWDAAQLRYRYKGRFVAAKAVKLAVRKVTRDSQAEMRDVTDQMIRGELSPAEWQARMSGEVKNLHVSGAMSGQGGPANMTRDDYLRVARRLKAEYRHLDAFARRVADGGLTPTQIRARVEMYVNGVNGSFEDAQRAAAINAGYEYERNVLGRTENHCKSGTRPGCVEQTKLGWVAIGTLVPIGSRSCMSNCKCQIVYKRAVRTSIFAKPLNA